MTAIGIILDTVEDLKDRLKDGLQPLDVFMVIKPLLLEFAMSDAVLPPEHVDRLQEKVHMTVRRAGLLKGVDL